jgi:hypothetical protein
MSQMGNVIICDDVDIGATTITDRARFSQTLIGKSTNISKLVQIGQNVTIREGCLAAAQTGIAIRTAILNFVVIGGQIGTAGHINIPDEIMIAGESSVASYKSKKGTQIGCRKQTWQSIYFSCSLESCVFIFHKSFRQFSTKINALLIIYFFTVCPREDTVLNKLGILCRRV